MPKFRVIPSILTDGFSQVKGARFDNWRSVGSVAQAVKVQSLRDVDELILLDVVAGRHGTFISPDLVAKAAKYLRVPLTVGGGVAKIEQIEALLNAGADKVVIGSSCLPTGALVEEASSTFGSQAIVCSIDSRDSHHLETAYRSGKFFSPITPESLALNMVKAGAGELLLQSVEHDGRMKGMDFTLLESVITSVTIPVLAGSGASSPDDFFRAASIGAAGVSAGAIFQFTEHTPDSIKASLRKRGIRVRL